MGKSSVEYPSSAALNSVDNVDVMAPPSCGTPSRESDGTRLDLFDTVGVIPVAGVMVGGMNGLRKAPMGI
jgi:hypothetical protein